MNIFDQYREIPLSQLLTTGVNTGNFSNDVTNSIEKDVSNTKITSVSAVIDYKFQDICFIGTNNGYIYEFKLNKFVGVQDEDILKKIISRENNKKKELSTGDSSTKSRLRSGARSNINREFEIYEALSDNVRERLSPDLKREFFNEENEAITGTKSNSKYSLKNSPKVDNRPLNDILECVGIYHVGNTSIEQIEWISNNESNGNALLLVLIENHIQCLEIIPPNYKNNEKLKTFRLHSKIVPTKGTSKFCMNQGRTKRVRYYAQEDTTNNLEPQICCIVKKRLIIFDVSISEPSIIYHKAINLSQEGPSQISWRDDVISAVYGTKIVHINYQSGDVIEQPSSIKSLALDSEMESHYFQILNKLPDLVKDPFNLFVHDMKVCGFDLDTSTMRDTFDQAKKQVPNNAYDEILKKGKEIWKTLNPFGFKEGSLNHTFNRFLLDMRISGKPLNSYTGSIVYNEAVKRLTNKTYDNILKKAKEIYSDFHQNQRNSFTITSKDVSDTKSVLLQYPFTIGVTSNIVLAYSKFDDDTSISLMRDFGNIIKISKPVGITSSNHLHIIGTSNSLLLITPRSYLSQVKDLILSSRFEEAQHLYEYILRIKEKYVSQYDSRTSEYIPISSNRKDETLGWMSDFFNILGWFNFKSLNFKVASNYFKLGNLVASELIQYFPDLISPEYKISKDFIDFSSIYLPEIKTVGDAIEHYIFINRIQENDISEQQIKFMKQARKNILEYLETYRQSRNSDQIFDNNNEESINEEFINEQRYTENAICKLYISSNNIDQLKSFLLEPNFLQIEDMERNIKDSSTSGQTNLQAKRCLAFIMWNKKQQARSMELLQGLIETEDETEGSISDMVHLLQKSTDYDLVWRFVPYIIDRNPYYGIKILTDDEGLLNFDHLEVIQFLETKSALSQILYYEYLITKKNFNDEHTHTKFLKILIGSVLKIFPDVTPGFRIDANTQQGLLGEYRSKILNFLRSPASNYNPKKILKSLENTILYEEMIEVYKRIPDHESVLKLLVHKLEDFNWAESYCLKISEERRLQEDDHHGSYIPELLILLKLFFDDKNKWKYGVHLLKTYNSRINSVEALNIIPDELTLQDMQLQLNDMIQVNITDLRTNQIIERLHQQQFYRLQAIRSQSLTKRIVVEEYSKCFVCNKLLGVSPIAALPNLSCVHVKCLNSPKLKDMSFIPLTNNI